MTPVVRTLLIANIGMFFLQSTMPAVGNAFVFVPQLALVRPWTMVTYMFLHGGLMHLAFNMIALFFFGPRVEQRIGSRPFTILYFVSGVTGAIFSFFLSPNAAVIGASAGVFGVMLAFAYFWPHERIFLWGVLPVPARILVIGTTVLALWGGFGGGQSNTAHFAHLGGYVGAFFYLLWLARRKSSFKRRVEAAPPEATSRVAASYRKIDMSRIHEVNRDEVNRILDKISAQGLSSLTPQERIFLSNFVPSGEQ